MWSIKQDTNELSIKQKQTQKTQRTDLWLPRAGDRDGFGVCNYQIQTITIQRMDKQHGPSVLHRELYQHPVINYDGKNMKKKYICLKESLCCMAESSTL